MNRALALPLCLLLCLGCQDSGGSSGGSSATPASSAPAQPAHWQAALAALAAAPQPEALRADSAAVALWNASIVRSWPRLSDYLGGLLDEKLQGMVGKGGSGFAVGSVTLTGHTLADPPAFSASSGASERLSLALPAAPTGWELDLEVGLDASLFGGSATITQTIDVAVAIRGLRVEQSVEVDTSDPLRPAILHFGAPQIALQLDVSSSHFLAGPLLSTVRPLLDAFVRDELDALVVDLTAQLGALSASPGPALGLGGNPTPFTGPRVDLESLAVAVETALLRDNFFAGMVFEANLDDPAYGSGNVQAYWGQGDSAFWTGHFLAALAYRAKVAPDPALEARADEILTALTRCLDVSPQGQLSRVAFPLASPYAAPLYNDPRMFVATLPGGSYIGLDDVSRDQYIGVVLGLGRVLEAFPALEGRAAGLIDRLLTYLHVSGWSAFENDGITLSASFAQNPLAMLALLQNGKRALPTRWGGEFDAWAPLLAVAWFPAWFGTLNTHEEYYKFNLLHDNLVNLCEVETDPDRYREYLKILRLERAALAHHQNAWFDAVYAMAVPPAATALGPEVETGLQRWAARPRRGYAVANSLDPQIPQTLFHFLDPSKPPEIIAAVPLPVERRRYADYLWQRSPFDLDGTWPDTFQAPGLDLLLPYWFGRAHGMF